MKHIIQKLKVKIGLAILKFDRFLNSLAEDVGLMGWCSMYGTLSVKHIKKDGTVKDYGVVSCKKVTDEFVAYLAGIMETDATSVGDFKYHLSGTGTTAESNDDTQLETPIGTAREVGDQNSSTNTYTSVATITYDDTYAVTEHGIFNEAYVSAQTDGTLLDRSVFSTVNVVNLESIQYTYTLTINAET